MGEKYKSILPYFSPKVGKSVRMTLDRNEDMLISGYEDMLDPFLSKYKVGFNKDGQIIALDMDMFCNAEWSHDLSLFVMHLALIHCENSYYIPNFRCSGRCFKTNLASNTAFRGFGTKQGLSTYPKVAHCLFLSAQYVETLPLLSPLYYSM